MTNVTFFAPVETMANCVVKFFFAEHVQHSTLLLFRKQAVESPLKQLSAWVTREDERVDDGAWESCMYILVHVHALVCVWVCDFFPTSWQNGAEL